MKSLVPLRRSWRRTCALPTSVCAQRPGAHAGGSRSREQIWLSRSRRSPLASSNATRLAEASTIDRWTSENGVSSADVIRAADPDGPTMSQSYGPRHRTTTASSTKEVVGADHRERERPTEDGAPVTRRDVPQHRHGRLDRIGGRDDLGALRQQRRDVVGQQADQLLAIGSRRVDADERALADEVALRWVD